jgi:hypothetical protein
MAAGWRGQYYRYRQLSLNLLAVYKQRSDLRAFLEIALSLSTLIVFIVFAIKPTALTMITLNQEINAKKATLNTLNQKISDLQIANDIYIQNEAAIPIIDTSVFTSPQPEILSKQIMGLAAKNSVNVLGISIDKTILIGQITTPKAAAPEAKPLPNGAHAMPISISATGSYSNLSGFLQDLEKLRIPIKFDSISVTSGRQSIDDSLVELITGRVPYLGKVNKSK